MCGLARECCANQGAKARESFMDFKLLQRRVAQYSPPRRARGIVQRFPPYAGAYGGESYAACLHIHHLLQMTGSYRLKDRCFLQPVSSFFSRYKGVSGGNRARVVPQMGRLRPWRERLSCSVAVLLLLLPVPLIELQRAEYIFFGFLRRDV